ncbi:MAG: DUF296 domain-containing protein [Deltaproteobacteria bacterium]|nr:DUF296 domain-containing protein [Deltaproteobacteria bacterium]
MDYRVGRINRVFFVRFDDGEDLRTCVEELAHREKIEQGLVLVTGAMKKVELVVGPKETAIPPEPVWSGFEDSREILGVGTLVQDPEGMSLHLHLAAGRGDEPVKVGCLRGENQVYLVAEVVILEINGLEAARIPDEASGLTLLSFR